MAFHAGLDADQIPALNKRTLTALKTPFILCKTSGAFLKQFTITIGHNFLNDSAHSQP